MASDLHKTSQLCPLFQESLAPLSYSADAGRVAAVQVLLAAGADPMATSTVSGVWGHTPVQYNTDPYTVCPDPRTAQILCIARLTMATPPSSRFSSLTRG